MHRPTIKSGIFQLDRKIEKQKGSFLAVGSSLVTGLLEKALLRKKGEEEEEEE